MVVKVKKRVGEQNSKAGRAWTIGFEEKGRGPHIFLDFYQLLEETTRSVQAHRRTTAYVTSHNERRLPRDRREGKGRSRSTRGYC